jgi:hypothetical protein
VQIEQADMCEKLLSESSPLSAKLGDGADEIDGVPEGDGDEIMRLRPEAGSARSAFRREVRRRRRI